MYKSAVSQKSIIDKFTEIQNTTDFVTIDEVPDIFIKAVVAVEDKRFYWTSNKN